MGSLLGRIRDDIEEYEELCERYGEKPEYSYGSADCYGEHCKKLKERRDREGRRFEISER